MEQTKPISLTKKEAGWIASKREYSEHKWNYIFILLMYSLLLLVSNLVYNYFFLYVQYANYVWVAGALLSLVGLMYWLQKRESKVKRQAYKDWEDGHI